MSNQMSKHAWQDMIGKKNCCIDKKLMEIRSDNTSVITSNDSGKKRRLVRRHLNYLIPASRL